MSETNSADALRPATRRSARGLCSGDVAGVDVVAGEAHPCRCSCVQLHVFGQLYRQKILQLHRCVGRKSDLARAALAHKALIPA